METYKDRYIKEVIGDHKKVYKLLWALPGNRTAFDQLTAEEKEYYFFYCINENEQTKLCNYGASRNPEREAVLSYDYYVDAGYGRGDNRDLIVDYRQISSDKCVYRDIKKLDYLRGYRASPRVIFNRKGLTTGKVEAIFPLEKKGLFRDRVSKKFKIISQIQEPILTSAKRFYQKKRELRGVKIKLPNDVVDAMIEFRIRQDIARLTKEITKDHKIALLFGRKGNEEAVIEADLQRLLAQPVPDRDRLRLHSNLSVMQQIALQYEKSKLQESLTLPSPGRSCRAADLKEQHKLYGHKAALEMNKFLKAKDTLGHEDRKKTREIMAELSQQLQKEKENKNIITKRLAQTSQERKGTAAQFIQLRQEITKSQKAVEKADQEAQKAKRDYKTFLKQFRKTDTVQQPVGKDPRRSDNSK